MGSSALGRTNRLLLLLLTLWSGQAPLLVVRACAEMPHAAAESPGATFHQHHPVSDRSREPQVHLCCNLCGLLRAGPSLPPAAFGAPTQALFTPVAAGSPFAQTFHGLGDVPLLPPALGPPVSSA